MKKEITWEDNPRIDCEKRIKQLQGRFRKVLSAETVWLSKYPNWKSKNQVIAKIIRHELRFKRAQLKDFDKCPKLKFD